MKKIIAVFSILILFCSCSSTKDANTVRPEIIEKSEAPKRINNYPVM